MDKELKALCGDVSLEGSPYDMWAHFADAVDVDTAKQAFFSVVRYFIIRPFLIAVSNKKVVSIKMTKRRQDIKEVLRRNRVKNHGVSKPFAAKSERKRSAQIAISWFLNLPVVLLLSQLVF
jgi:hypothetical protein